MSDFRSIIHGAEFSRLMARNESLPCGAKSPDNGKFFFVVLSRRKNTVRLSRRCQDSLDYIVVPSRRDVITFRCCHISPRKLHFYRRNLWSSLMKIALIFHLIVFKNQTNFGKQFHGYIAVKYWLCWVDLAILECRYSPSFRKGRNETSRYNLWQIWFPFFTEFSSQFYLRSLILWKETILNFSATPEKKTARI